MPRGEGRARALVQLAVLLTLLLAGCPEATGFHVRPPSPPSPATARSSRITFMQSMEARPPPPTATALLGRAGATLATAALSVLLPLSSPLPATAAATVAATIPPRHTTTTFLANTAVAAANLPEDVLAAALVSLGKGASLDRITAPAAEGQPPSSPALYVTARVGARGRVLASLRVPLADLPNGGFPAEVAVRTADIYADTPEAKEEVARSIRRRDLLLSARLDRDGQASTRDPEDLVGQGTVYKFGADDSAQWSRATIELGGRGAFGELVTGKRK